MSLIKLIQVTKQFNGKQGKLTAVDQVDLAIEAGEIFGVIGYSGAGKSTLIRLLNQLEKPTDGKIIINGQTVNDLKGAELRGYRKKIGMIFQHFNLLWSRTVIENIMLPLELTGVSKPARRKRAQELIKLVGLEGREDAYPSQLSGGQKQRVGIARALANEPEILLCDEATSALDPQTTDEVLDLLLAINQKLNLTIVLITHEMNVIRKICDRVAVMEDGKVIEVGEVLSVFKNPQHEVTKKFVQQDNFADADESESALDYLVNAYPDGIIVRLIFEGEKSKEATISKAIHSLPIDINVLQATIRQTQHTSFGTMLVQITGEQDALAKSLAFFKEHEVGTEVIQRG
ncbi:methionine ABC transporter ATP-binding protein [Vagococcus acidifermentans]|uniref:Methionine ABC transporter ATP-binding protein n=1 Tax=Vagococcus acidifermentans TaxID=564710 RepID=A0A430B0T1_9ENTE|nr:methionine ABC transporter ATP-binding protein [Vagococcus acidifermentans]RSU13924.1 methionine ABC transporter ATP-binding protein [Vagococcus acidifermentans]